MASENRNFQLENNLNKKQYFNAYKQYINLC